MRLSSSKLLTGVAALGLALAGCGGGSSASSAGSTLSGSITVVAAASLKESFTVMGRAFESGNPRTKVSFSFGASSALAQQIVQGAPADVFASASPTTMQQVVDRKVANDAKAFAKNVLEIAVPPGNPAKIDTLSDLATPGVKVVLCQPQVPCGALARTVLANARVNVTPVSLEADVTSTLTKVQLGEADAALVYVTDVTSAGAKVKGVRIPADVNSATTYSIATLTTSKNALLAYAFVAYVLSSAGRSELTTVGFQPP